jgi:hypothetical protein
MLPSLPMNVSGLAESLLLSDEESADLAYDKQ